MWMQCHVAGRWMNVLAKHSDGASLWEEKACPDCLITKNWPEVGLQRLLELSTISNGSTHLVAWLPAGMDDQAAVRQAAAHGVDTVAVSDFGMEPVPRGGLILGYAAVPECVMREGVRRLAAALHSLPPTSRP
jgi:hypothetical protein